MAEQSLKKKAVSGMVWTSVEKFGLQAMQLVIGIVIARILAPEDYGIVGMTAIARNLGVTYAMAKTL